LILQRQIEQRGERRKCLDADIRLSCQKPGVRTCRPIEHPGRHFKRPICLRLFQRAAEDDKTILVDGPMNANSATKPGMMPIKNLAKNGPVGVLKPRCTTDDDRIRALTTAPRIKPTSIFLRSAWRPNPGRGSTYRRGIFVRTTGTSSVPRAVLRHPQIDSEQAFWCIRHGRVDFGAVRSTGLDTSPVRSTRFRPVCPLLVFAGGKPPEGTWLILSRIGAAYYFLHFLVVLPLVGRLEKAAAAPIQHQRTGTDAVRRQGADFKDHDGRGMT